MEAEEIHDNDGVPEENFGDDPDEEVEIGDLDGRMDALQDQLDEIADADRADRSIDENALVDQEQLDEP